MMCWQLSVLSGTTNVSNMLDFCVAADMIGGAYHCRWLHRVSRRARRLRAEHDTRCCHQHHRLLAASRGTLNSGALEMFDISLPYLEACVMSNLLHLAPLFC